MCWRASYKRRDSRIMPTMKAVVYECVPFIVTITYRCVTKIVSSIFGLSYTSSIGSINIDCISAIPSSYGVCPGRNVNRIISCTTRYSIAPVPPVKVSLPAPPDIVPLFNAKVSLLAYQSRCMTLQCSQHYQLTYAVPVYTRRPIVTVRAAVPASQTHRSSSYRRLCTK